MSKEIKKIIHCADIHIRTYRMHNEYKEVFKTFINKSKILLEDYVYNEARIVIAGDLVHQKITISNEQLMLCCWFLKELTKIAPVVIIAGNHDLLENNKDRMDSISPMIDLIGDENIHYLKESKCYPDENIVWCNYSIFEGNKKPEIDIARVDYGEDKTYIGLWHAPLIGLKTDLGYEFDHGATKDEFIGCDMVLCGDIHKRGGLLLEDGNKKVPIMMSSSLIQQNYGESVDNHGFLLWDVENRTYEEHNLYNPYGFYQFKITSIDDVEENKEILVNK